MTMTTSQSNTMKKYGEMRQASVGSAPGHRDVQYSNLSMPDSLRARAGFDAQSAAMVTSEEKFDAFFKKAMTETRRGDLAGEYDRLSGTEKSMFVTVLANRGVLDKQKSRKRTKEDTFVEQGLRTQMISDMTDAMRMSGESMQTGVKAEPSVYAKAARMMRSAQVSDKDLSLSKRKSYYDLKLVNRAFKFLAVVRDKANDADMQDAQDPTKQVNERIQGGYDEDKVVNFHKNATLKEKATAANVTDMASFAAFYQSLRKEGSKNIAKFEKYSDTQKQLFVYALANPSKVVKWVGPLRKSGRHNDLARQNAKNNFAGTGQVTLSATEFRKAAMMLLSKDGRHSKSKLSYNQPIVRDAMHFVRAAEMTQVKKLRQKHEDMAKNDADLSGDTKWSATNSIDVARGSMRILADKVSTPEDFEAFLVQGLERSGAKYQALAERFKALDKRQKIIFIRGLSHRSTTEGNTDRSRIKILRGLGNLFAASSVKNEQGRTNLVNEYISNKKLSESDPDSTAEMTTAPDDPKRAAINLVSKDTQALLGDKGWFIDVGMVERGFQLVDDAEKRLRKSEAKEADGYVAKASELRKRYAEGDNERKDKQYQAVSLATRQNVKDAGEVKDKTGFEAFFQSLMESDDNTKRWEAYAQYSDDEKAMFVRALAHRDIIDRERDHAIVTRYLRLHDLHGYFGRETRDQYKKEFADAGVSQTQGNEDNTVKAPEAGEYTAAAYAILSRESRRWNWLSKATHRKTGDDRLIERAMKLVDVAGDKREAAQDEARSQFMKDNGMEGEITRRATREMKNSADAAKDLPSFAQFLAETVDKDRMSRYTALSERDKKLFVRALADRKILDHKNRKEHEDDAGRAGLTGSTILNEIDHREMQMDAAVFKRAAYNVLSSKGRALGTHRFLGIKFGAADNKLLDRAFRFLKETDVKRDEIRQTEDRVDVMKQYGIAKMTSQADYEKRKQADAVNSVETFREFFSERVRELGKEKYIYLFDSYNAEAKKVFISALALGNKAKRKETQKKQKPSEGFQGGVYDAAKSPRAAAYRLLSHRNGDVDAMHFARDMAEDYIRRDYETKKASAAANNEDLSYKEYRKNNGFTDMELDEATEYEREGKSTEHGKASWLRRKSHETFRNAGRGGSDLYRRHVEWVSTKVQNLDDGTFKHGAAKLFLFTLNPLIKTNEKMGETSHDGQNQRAGGVKNQEEFMSLLYDMAKSEGRVSLYNSVKKLSKDQLNLFIHALQDRDIIDQADGEEAAYESRNQEERESLTKKYADKQLAEPGEAEWKQAALSLVSNKKTGKLGGLDQVQVRKTIADWDLVQDALAYVQFEAEDERALNARMHEDGRGDEEREQISVYGEDEGFIDQAKNLAGTGMAAKNLYGAASKAMKAGQQYGNGEMARDVTVQTLKTLGKPGELKEKAKDMLGVDSLDMKSITGKLGGIGDAVKMAQKIQEHDVFKSLTQSATTVAGLATGSKSLIQNSAELVINSLDMNKLRGQSDTFDKQMMLRDRMDIVTDAIADAFDMAKELKAKDINDKVFGILDAVCSLGTTAAAMAGVPLPVTKLINNLWKLVSAGAKWIVGKIIELVNGDRLKSLLKTKERTHEYNQKVKAFNAQLGDRSKKMRDLLTEGQMQRLLLSQSGLKNEKNARDYICRKTATCLVYAYGSKDPKNPERLAAAGLFGSLKVPFKAGGKPPKVGILAAKLRGAH